MSIEGKVRAWINSPQGQARIQAKLDEYVKSGVSKTAAGDDVINEAKIMEAAEKLISVIRSTAESYGLPASVMQHFDSLDCSGIHTMSDGTSEVYIYFGGDLHRESLYPAGYGGVSNIVAVLNNGYSASNYVYGEWKGHTADGEFIRSRKDRDGLHFIQQAVADFNGNYGAEYNATAVAGDSYQ